MELFTIEQKWVTMDGRQHGEVVEISDDGASGSVDVVDSDGVQNTFHGTAEAFQLLPGDWRVLD
jgi:hypothetical protein